MSITTLALLIIGFGVIFFGFGMIGLFILFMSRDTTRIPELVSRIQSIENLVTKIAADIELETGSNLREVWRTSDGRYSANSFEELLSKMATDPNGPLSQDEIDAIKSVFNKIVGDEGHDDEGENDKPWEK